jgi:hypothetical protein
VIATPRIEIVLLGAALLGALTGFAGWLTAKGSKFWQENWEAHVEMLEELAGEGRLTQVVVCQDSPAFSVSRVNQELLRILALGWVALIVIEACPSLKELIRGARTSSQAIVVLFLVVVAGLWLFLKNRTRLVGREITLGETAWAAYSRRKKAGEPTIIWRDPVSEKPPSEGVST